MKRLILLCLLVGAASAMLWSPHLQGYWPFEGNRLDASGNGRTAYGVGTAVVAGLVGKCDSFLPVSYDTIRDTDSLSFTIGGGHDLPFSVALWMTPDSLVGVQIIQKMGNTSQREWTMSISGTIEGRITCAIYSGGVSTNFVNIGTDTSDFKLQKGVPAHVVVTYGGHSTQGRFLVYVNGEHPLGTYSVTGTYVGMGNYVGNVFVGTYGPTPTSNCFKGKMDEIAIWNAELSPSDVKRVYMGLHPLCPQLNQPVIAFTFDDGKDDCYTNALPAMQGHPATSYVVSDSVGAAGYMTLAQILGLDSAGWSVGNHTKNHRRFDQLDRDSIQIQLDSCRAYLNSVGLSSASSHVCYPTGATTATSDSVMNERNYLTGRTVQLGLMAAFPIDTLIHIPVLFTCDSQHGLAAAKVMVDSIAKCRGRAAVVLLHRVVSGDHATEKNSFPVDSLSALVTYCETKGLHFMNIEQLYEEQMNW